MKMWKRLHIYIHLSQYFHQSVNKYNRTENATQYSNTQQQQKHSTTQLAKEMLLVIHKQTK